LQVSFPRSDVNLGWSSCPLQIAQSSQCLTNTSWKHSLLLSTSLAFYRRRANTIYSRTNSSLLTITNVSQASPETVSPTDILLVLDRFFNVNPALAANQTTTTLALMAFLWSNMVTSENTTAGLASSVTLLRSLVTVPLLWFQANYLSSGIIPLITADAPAPNLPEYLYSTANIAKSNNRIVIAQWTVISFMALGMGIYIWCLAWLSWATSIQGPNISQFPVMDFASRIVSGGMAEDSVAATIAPLARTSEFRKNLEGVRVFLGEVWHEDSSGEANEPGVAGGGAAGGEVRSSTESGERQKVKKDVVNE